MNASLLRYKKNRNHQHLSNSHTRGQQRFLSFEHLETRRVLAADLGSVSISNLVEDPDTGECSAVNPTISYNGATLSILGTAEVLDNNGNVSVNVNGMVSSGSQALFDGNFTIDINGSSASISSLSATTVDTSFQVGGATVDSISTMEFVSGGVELDLQATLPDELSGSTIDVTSLGVIGGNVSEGDVSTNDSLDLDLGGFLLSENSAQLELDGDELKLTGSYTLDQLDGVTISLDSNNYFSSSESGVDFTGTISIETPLEITDDWQVNSLELMLNTSLEVSGSGELMAGDDSIALTEVSFSDDAFAFEMEVDGGPEFNLLGMEFDISSFDFTSDRDGGGDWDPEATIQGTVTAPEEFGGFEIEVDGSDELLINADGLEVSGGSVSFPDEETFNLLGLLEVKSEDAELEFDFEDEEAKLTGSFVIPTLNDLTIDLTDDNYVSVRESGDSYEVAMSATFENLQIDIVEGWSLENGTVMVDAPYGSEGTIEGTFEIQTPGEILTMDLAFAEGQLEQIEVSSDVEVDFSLLGIDIDIETLTFLPVRDGGTEPWDPEMQLSGTALLPEEFGGFEIEINAGNMIVVNTEGVSVTGGSIALPGTETFDVLGLLEVEVTDAQIDFDFDSSEAKLMGTFNVPTLNDFTLDLSGDSYFAVRLQNDEVQFAAHQATFSVDDLPVFDDWSIEDIELTFTKEYTQAEGSIDASASLITPEMTEIELAMEFEEGTLTEISADSPDEGTDFSFFGTEVDLANVTFRPVREGAEEGVAFDPELAIQGTLILPALFGEDENGDRVTINVGSEEGSDNMFIINSEGVDLTGAAISFPEMEITLLNVVNASVSGLTIEYESDPGSLKVQGIARLENLFGSGVAIELNFDPDEDRAIEITNNDGEVEVLVNGEITVEDISIGGGFEITEATFEFDNTGEEDEFGVEVMLEIPSGMEIGGSMEFIGGNLNAISIDAEDFNPGIPIGTTGILVTGIEGSIENFAPDAEEPLTFSGAIDLTYGPRVDISVPSYLGDLGDIEGALLVGRVEATISEDMFMATGQLAVVGNIDDDAPEGEQVTGLLTAEGSITIDWDEPLFEAAATFEAFAGLLELDSTLTIQESEEDESLEMSLFSTLTLEIPNDFPIIGSIIGGSSASGSAAVYANTNDDASDDFIAIWTTFTIEAFNYDITGGVRLNMDGTFDLIYSEAELPPNLGNAELGTIELEEESELFEVTIDWDNDISYKNITYRYTPEGGSPITNPVEDGGASSITVQPGEDTKVLISIENALPGTWEIIAIPPDDLEFENIQFSGPENTNENPHVLDVVVNSDTWSDEFRSVTNGSGGLRVYEAGSSTVPVVTQVGVNQIIVQMSEDVTLPEGAVKVLQADSTELEAVVTFNSANTQIIIDLASPLESEKVLLHLSNSITDSEGNPLDGNNDLETGDPLNLRFDVLAGDVNGNRTVTTDDLANIAIGIGASSTDTNYDPLLDVDGSGGVTVTDYVNISSRLLNTLPAGEPVPPPAAPNSTSGTSTSSDISTDIVTVTFTLEDSRLVASEESEAVEEEGNETSHTRGSRLDNLAQFRELDAPKALPDFSATNHRQNFLNEKLQREKVIHDIWENESSDFSNRFRPGSRYAWLNQDREQDFDSTDDLFSDEETLEIIFAR